jgi:RHS repeat-associated protein
MLADHQGSIRQIVDNTGNLLNQITYDSYGNITNQTNPSVTFRFGYTGREWDGETGQYYYRARYYDARVGRFLSTDPIGFTAGDANLYRYVGNSPTNATDPSGLLSINPLDFTTFGMVSPILDGLGVDTSAIRSRFNIHFNAGEGQGESAQRYWASRVINDCLPWYERAGSFVAGSFASLWTNGTSDATFTTLTAALGVARPAANSNLSGANGLGSFQNFLATGQRGGLRRNLAAIRANNFRNNSTVYYHGTNSAGAASIRSGGINLQRGRANMDFGQGFYATQSRSHAVARAGQTVQRFGGTPEVLTYRVPNSQLSQLNGLSFPGANSQWSDFVMGNRAGILPPHGYDYVSGPVLRNLSTGSVWPYPSYNQTSLHTSNAVTLFNSSLR